MKESKYLSFYKAYAVDGKMPLAGLCHHFDFKKYKRQFELVSPSYEDKRLLAEQDKNWIWWGSNSKYKKPFKFTPLRQNLVLLMAALNNEL